MGLRGASIAFTYDGHVLEYPKGEHVPRGVVERSDLIVLDMGRYWEAVKNRYGIPYKVFETRDEVFEYAREYGLGELRPSAEDAAFAELCRRAKLRKDAKHRKQTKERTMALRTLLRESWVEKKRYKKIGESE